MTYSISPDRGRDKLELKEYQQEALATFRQWRDALLESQGASPGYSRYSGAGRPAAAVDAPAEAWERLREQGALPANAGDYVARHDAAGRPIPHVCFKVPTGGGKTLLAAAALRSLHRESGLVLWITPTAAIYQQTRHALRDRQHPCRQLLDTGAGGRVKFLEKDDALTRDDLENYLCIMLLSLPAANRQRNRDFLRMFRNSGRYATLFPSDDAGEASRTLLSEFPDLDLVNRSGIRNHGPGIKHSLFNVLKMQRPVVILDEAHKAYGSRDPDSNQEYVRAINQFDPSLVVELSATPNPGISNLLVDISGTRLKDEQMVKLPVQVEAHPDGDWRRVVSHAAARLEDLTNAAESFHSVSNRYIRPIAVVRVERTGQDQRDAGRVHAEDVREFLIRGLGIPANHVAIQSSESREISGVDLTSPYSQIRWIITRAALMEGWDCAFAYVLVMLDNTTAQRAITQLVGRIMRQPGAHRTGNPALDQCYVICANSNVRVAVQQVKRGLEREGLADLVDEVVVNRERGPGRFRRSSQQPTGRGELAATALHRKDDGWVRLDWQKHILVDINWAAVAAPSIMDRESTGAARRASVDVDDVRGLSEADRRTGGTVRIEWFTRQLIDLIPSPWMAARVTKDFLALLRAEGYLPERIFRERSRLAAALRSHVTQTVEDQAGAVFRAKLRNGVIRLDLEVNRLEDCVVETPRAEVVVEDIGRPSAVVTADAVHTGDGWDANSTDIGDSGLAWYGDESSALNWWRRTAMGQGGEHHRIGRREQGLLPDVVVARQGDGTGIRVWESQDTRWPTDPADDWEETVRSACDAGLDCGIMRVTEGPARGNYRLLFRGLTQA